VPTLEQWALIAEIVAALGVIASIIYLAVQMRLSRVAAEAQLSYSSLEVYSRWRTALVDNTDLSRAIAKANRGEALCDYEAVQVSALMDELFMAAAISFNSTRESGALHDRSLDIEYVVGIFHKNPGLVAEWERFRMLADLGFADYRRAVDGGLEQKKINRRDDVAA
jgi:hypothetical protein